MQISKQDLESAVVKGVLTRAQADKLWHILSQGEQDTATPSFSFINVIYYLGALIVMSALTIFMSYGWDWFGGLGIAAIATVYALSFMKIGHHLWYVEHQKIPGGLMFTLAVAMTPLIIYGIQKWSGLWIGNNPDHFNGFFSYFSSSWIIIEIGTVVAGLTVLHYIRFPFLVFPIAFALWFLSIDIVSLLWNQTEVDWDTRCWVSLVFGVGMLLLATAVDRRTKEDFAFWLYFFGSIALFIGLYLLWNHGGEAGKFLYCLISVGLIFSAIVLDRQVLMVFGAIGVFSYLSYLAYSVFADSILFPFILSFIGLGIIYAGLTYHRLRKNL